MTEKPNPPFNLPNTLPNVSSHSSAIFDFSNIKPIKTNKGTATSNSFVIVPKIFDGISARKFILNKSNDEAMNANKIETPAKVKATGKPNNKKQKVIININMLNISVVIF